MTQNVFLTCRGPWELILGILIKNITEHLDHILTRKLTAPNITASMNIFLLVQYKNAFCISCQIYILSDRI